MCSQDACERLRHTVEVEGLDEERGVADLPASTAAHEAPQLVAHRTVAPDGLVLERPERGEIAVLGDDLLNARRAERADQLVLEVDLADEEGGRNAGALERAAELGLLAGVAQTADMDATEPFERPPDRLRASDRDDRDALRGEVVTETPGERLEGDAVARPLHEHDGARTHRSRRSRSSSASVAGSRRSRRSPRARSACAGGMSSARKTSDDSLRTSAPDVPRTAWSDETTATCSPPLRSAARRSMSVSASSA